MSQASGRLFTKHPLVKSELICQCISISNFLYESLSLEQCFFKCVLLQVTSTAQKLWLIHLLPIWTSPNGRFMVTIAHSVWRNLCTGYFVCFQDVVETPSSRPAVNWRTCHCFWCFRFFFSLFLDVLSLKKRGLGKELLQALQRPIRNKVRVS